MKYHTMKTHDDFSSKQTQRDDRHLAIEVADGISVSHDLRLRYRRDMESKGHAEVAMY